MRTLASPALSYGTSFGAESGIIYRTGRVPRYVGLVGHFGTLEERFMVAIHLVSSNTERFGIRSN